MTAPRSPSRRRRLAARATGLAVVLSLLAPGIVAGHPLGNFTINHYAGIRVSPESIALDVVIDQAEIPAFQERLRLDTDDDGDVSAAEADAARGRECAALATSLDLAVDVAAVSLELIASGLSFPAGAGGLPTLRLVCGFEAVLRGPLADGAVVRFEDRSYPERIGWREIVVAGDRVTPISIDGAPLAATSISERLTAYPQDLLAQPLDVRSVSWRISLGGPELAPFVAPDARPIGGSAPEPSTVGAPPRPGAIVPGGVAAEIPEIFQAADLTPILLIVALLTAIALGAGHALTPGHGKTLMAAYLVGTRGTPLHAVGLGLSVTVSHTIGILVLAALVAGSQQALPTDVVIRATPVIAAVTIVVIGTWMLAGEIRRRRNRTTASTDAHGRELDHGHAGDHEHEHDPGHHHDDHDDGAGDHEHSSVEDAAIPAGSHRHGGIVHSHLPPPGTTITWRSLFALGLAGGLIPSVSALLILLGTIATGRAAFGIVLVVAFGIGMALVMTGVGLAMVFARSRLDRLPSASGLGRLAVHAPVVAAVLVLGLGLWLTQQALFGSPVF